MAKVARPVLPKWERRWRHFWRQDLPNLLVLYIHKERANKTSVHEGLRNPEAEEDVWKSQECWKRNRSEAHGNLTSKWE